MDGAAVAAGSGGEDGALEPTTQLAPARIALLYESRDGRLCVFEDAQGHLTAVRAARLA